MFKAVQTEEGWDIVNDVHDHPPLTQLQAERIASVLNGETFDPVADIEAFHERFELAYDGKPRALPEELATFRIRFMQEELTEYGDANEDLLGELEEDEPEDAEIAALLEDQLDALVDEVYVVLGTSYLQGFDFREAWRRVHVANMAKVRAASAADSARGSTFDVVKPPGWVAPDHSDLVEDHAHRVTP